MRRTATLGATTGGVLAVLLGLSACSGDAVGYPGSPPPGSTPDQTVPTQTTPAVPQGAAAVAGDRITPPPDADPATVAVWTTGDGRTVGTFAQEGGCSRAEARLADQTPERITITLVEVLAGPGDTRVCTMDIRYPEVTVVLDAPLGERAVVLQRTQETGA